MDRQDSLPTQHEVTQIDHLRVRELMGEFARTGDLASTKAVLATLISELAEHFKEEESTGGLFEDMRNTAPEKDALITNFEVEHAQMLRALHELRLRISEVEKAIAGIGDAKKAFLRSLAKHEQAENRLMLDCYYEDLGIGD